MRFRVALITDVFYGNRAGVRLAARLKEAAVAGARLAVLPELPLDRWCPATTEVREDDAEEVNGPRQRLMGDAAVAAGIAVVGGAIVVDAATGSRHNTALTIDSTGKLIDAYEKLHLPDEPGFRETHHYQPGRTLPRVISELGLPFGVQICSDANRPQGTHLLSGLGAHLVVVPRSTEAVTYPRWRTVLRANAITGAVYVISVNRPGPEADVGIGGPSVVVAPDGEVLLETVEPVVTVEIDSDTIDRARQSYPGYLPIRADLYRDGWSGVSEGGAAGSPS